MRIGLLSYEYPPETGFGGIGTYTWTQARALARLGHEVHVLAGSRAGAALRRVAADGVTVWRRGAEGPVELAARALAAGGMHWSRNRIENAVAMRDLLREVAEQVELDLVEMPECGAEGLLLDAVEPGHRLVRFHSPAELIQPFYEVPRRDRAVCARLERRALARAGAWTACSRFLAEAAAARFAPPAAIEVVANGVDLEVADAEIDAAPGAWLEPPAGRRLVLFCGRLERRKGAHLLPAIAAGLAHRADVALAVVGQDLFGMLEGEILPRLAERAPATRVLAPGAQPLARVRAALRAADVVLVPSLWESCPYAVLEAMAAAAPIVAAAAGGVPELVRDGREALLAPVGDAAALAAAVDRLLDDLPLARRLGEGARARVERELSAPRVAERSVAFYRRVLGAGGAR